ncbi:MAG: response regulator [Deltaproteobacteria bacterium]|nr:response regulator [Deltaproteobacteria bacterium]
MTHSDHTDQVYQGPIGIPRVLIIDDEEVIIQVLRMVLEKDFRLAVASTGTTACSIMEREPADIILLDKNLPDAFGLELISRFKRDSPDVEVIVMTGYASLESAIEALRLGAYDYLVKPFDNVDIVAEKVRLAAEKKELSCERRQLMDQIVASNHELRQAHDRLRQGYLETVTGMITALEARDAYTRGHSDRVALYSVTIAREMGMGGEQLANLNSGALLHDLGKIGVREEVLNKRGRLTDEEYEHIKTHPIVGAEIIGKMDAYKHLLPMIRHHHERIDGRGYPDGIRGDEICIEARIIAVADCFDAMTSKRPYRDPRSAEEAIAEIRKCAGSQLDPTAVGAFLIAHKRNAFRDVVSH